MQVGADVSCNDLSCATPPTLTQVHPSSMQQSQFEHVYNIVPPLMESIIAQCGDILSPKGLPRGSAIQLLRGVSPAIGEQASTQIKRYSLILTPDLASVGRVVKLLRNTRLQKLDVELCTSECE